ncbi:hypothetical protein Nmel_014801 [Mimus melanotis]
MGCVSGSVSGPRAGSCLCVVDPGCCRSRRCFLGASLALPALSHCGRRPNLYRIQPSAVPGKRAQRNLPFLRLPGRIPKAGSSPEKETGFGYLIAGAEFVLL